MKLVNEQGLEEDAAYDANLLAFIFEDMEIRDPFRSECSRFPVDPVSYYGFKPVETGGGCEALVKTLENGHYLMLTDESGTCLPDIEDPGSALIGRYNENGDMLAICDIKDVPMIGESLTPDRKKKDKLSDGPEF